MLMRIARKLLRTALAVGVGALSFALAPLDLIDIVSGELVNFFGFVIAAVIPAMALTSTALRGTGMSIRRINQLQAALEAQMRFWAGLVVYGFVSVVLVILFKPLVKCGSGGCTPVQIVSVWGYGLDSRIGNALIGFTFTLVFSQLWNVVIGLMALLQVNAEAAKAEAQQRFDEALEPTRSDIKAMRNPPAYGSTLKLPGIGES